MHDVVVFNAKLYPMRAGNTSAVAHTSFAIDDGKVSAAPARKPGRREIDARGRVVLPGFVDCHTHALFAGDRMQEHAARHAGASYEEIAAAGGGIMTTVNAVRAASETELVEQTLPRLRALRREGVTCVEIKSGYGLDTASELKMLRAIARLRAHIAMDIHATFLGAHTVPAGRDADDYLREVIDEMLPQVAAEELGSAVDIYVEPIAFQLEHMRKLFAAAADYGLPTRVHAEQLSASGAASLAASLGARSADHLEYLDDAGAAALAAAGVVAVLLPGAFYFLAEKQRPPLTELRRHGVTMAVASDLNPGTSPLCTLLGAAHMAVHLFGMTPAEALAGITFGGAQALGCGADTGHLDVGAWANFSLWDIPAPEYLTYQLGGLYPDAVFYRGLDGDDNA